MRIEMKPQLFLTLILALAVAATASAQRVELFAPTAGDLAGSGLAAPAGWKAAELARDSVTWNAPLAADKAIELRPATFTSRSREYWLEVSAADLERGVPVFAGAPGALVRLNPVTSGAPAIDPAALELRDPAGKVFAAGSGMELAVSADQLRAAGAPFVEGTAAFRIRADLGAGTFELRADRLAGGRYVLQVFDHASDVEIALRSLAADHLHGQTLTVEAFLGRGDARLAMAGLEGFVTSPAGRAWPLELAAAGDGSYRGELVLDALEAPAPGLWEAHVRGHGLVDGVRVLRSARVAFHVAVASARFDGAAALVAAKDRLGVRLGIEAAAGGRYEARGILFGSDPDGVLHPIAVAHSAAWLEAGHGALELVFDRTHVKASGLAAPFEIRDLRLIDQGTMGLLHRQARGLAIRE